MNNLKYVIDQIYDFLLTQVENTEEGTRIHVKEIVSAIKGDSDAFFLHAVMEPVDVDIFLTNFARYMKIRFPELEKIWIVQKFFIMEDAIVKTAKLMDSTAFTFCDEKTNTNFIKGFLMP